METTYMQVLTKKRDYKVCEACNRINWYENKKCVECGSKKFREITLKDLEKEYSYYEQEGYNEEQIDNILVEV